MRIGSALSGLLLVLFTLGLGMFIGAQVAGRIEAQHTTDQAKAFAAQIESAETDEEKAALRKHELQSIEWKPLWGKPAIFAGIVMLVFIALFRDDRKRDEKTEPDANGDDAPEET